MTRAKTFSSISNHSKRLQRLAYGAKSLQHQQSLLNKYLPPALQGSIILSFKHGILQIEVSAGVLATQLRFNSDIIRKQLINHSEFFGLKKIESSIKPNNRSEKFKKSGRLPPISQENAKLIAQTAKITSDKGLSQALMRLSKHIK